MNGRKVHAPVSPLTAQKQPTFLCQLIFLFRLFHVFFRLCRHTLATVSTRTRTKLILSIWCIPLQLEINKVGCRAWWTFCRPFISFQKSSTASFVLYLFINLLITSAVQFTSQIRRNVIWKYPSLSTWLAINPYNPRNSSSTSSVDLFIRKALLFLLI